MAKECTEREPIDSEREALIEIGKSWPGHAGVDWNTTTSDGLYQLILDARELDKQRFAEIRLALWDYHHALDTREHGDIAANRLRESIQDILGRQWEQGATLNQQRGTYGS